MGVLRRLQEIIEQANLKYRAADVFGFSLVLAGASFVVLGLSGVPTCSWCGCWRPPPSAACRWSTSCACARGACASSRSNCPTPSTCSPAPCAPATTSTAAWRPSPTRPPTPCKMEFKKLMEELALGSQVEPALHGLGKRVPLIDLKFFITSLILQRQTGANMVAVLEGLSALVRERLNMAAKLKAHTAQQRFSAGLLCALPLVVGHGLLHPQARIHPAAVDRPHRQQVSHLCHHFGDRGHPGDPQDRQHPGMRTPC